MEVYRGRSRTPSSCPDCLLPPQDASKDAMAAMAIIETKTFLILKKNFAVLASVKKEAQR
jgi:hypothetical protein